MLCHTYHYLYGIDVTVLRYFTVYGPAGRPDMSRGAEEQGSRGAFLLCPRAPLLPCSELGSDQPVVLMDAIRLVEELVGKKANIEYKPRHPADVLATWADIGKAERLLGWRPRSSFEQGVAHLVAWYQANRDWAKEVTTY